MEFKDTENPQFIGKKLGAEMGPHSYYLMSSAGLSL